MSDVELETVFERLKSQLSVACYLSAGACLVERLQALLAQRAAHCGEPGKGLLDEYRLSKRDGDLKAAASTGIVVTSAGVGCRRSERRGV
jgi:hypothetical protein